MNKELLRDLLEINELVWKDPEDLAIRYNTLDDKAKFRSVLSYYIGMATMVKENLIDLKIIPDMFTIAVSDFWEKYQPAFATLSTGPYTRFEHALDMVEYLYQTIQERNPQHTS
jgi:hypothetical protein